MARGHRPGRAHAHRDDHRESPGDGRESGVAADPVLLDALLPALREPRLPARAHELRHHVGLGLRDGRGRTHGRRAPPRESPGPAHRGQHPRVVLRRDVHAPDADGLVPDGRERVRARGRHDPRVERLAGAAPRHHHRRRHHRDALRRADQRPDRPHRLVARRTPDRSDLPGATRRRVGRARRPPDRGRRTEQRDHHDARRALRVPAGLRRVERPVADDPTGRAPRDRRSVRAPGSPPSGDSSPASTRRGAVR